MHDVRLSSSGRIVKRGLNRRGLALRHSRRWGVWQSIGHASPSLRSLRSIPVTGLRRYYGRSDSCSSGSSALASMNAGLLRTGLPESRTQPSDRSVSKHRVRPPNTALTRYPSAYWASFRSGLRLSYAGSPKSLGRIEFVILRTGRSPPVASHPVSPRRSYVWLQAGERLLGEDFHLSDRVRFQAHVGASGARPAAFRICRRNRFIHGF